MIRSMTTFFGFVRHGIFTGESFWSKAVQQEQTQTIIVPT